LPAFLIVDPAGIPFRVLRLMQRQTMLSA